MENVVSIRPEYHDIVIGLRNLADTIEKGEVACDIAAIVTRDEEGCIEVYGLGPRCDTLRAIGLLGLGLYHLHKLKDE